MAQILTADGELSGFVTKTDRTGKTYAPGTITIHYQGEELERVAITAEDGILTIQAWDLANTLTPATITIDEAGGMSVSTV